MENECEYISSMGFRKSCTLTSLIDSDNIDEYDFEKLQTNDLLYIKTDKLLMFSKIIDMIDTEFILITGCSDYTIPFDIFSEKEFNKFISNKNLIHWYAQNCMINHNKISLLPIGLDYHTISNNDTKWGKQMIPIKQEKILKHVKNSGKPFWEREIKIFSNCHFQMNTKFGYERYNALQMIPSNLLYLQPSLQIRQITWICQLQYAFILCPFGNGYDCHRTWESLILGNIPIVKTSNLDKLYINLPVLIVKDWTEITLELLTMTIQKFKTQNFNYEKLKLQYWMNNIRNCYNRNLN